MNLVGASFICVGLAFVLIGGIGAIRLPDFYTRSHALSVMDTLGTLLILGGMTLVEGFSQTSVKLVLLLSFIHVANPTITHILVRAALRSGLKPWGCDD